MLHWRSRLHYTRLGLTSSKLATSRRERNGLLPATSELWLRFYEGSVTLSVSQRIENSGIWTRRSEKRTKARLKSWSTSDMLAIRCPVGVSYSFPFSDSHSNKPEFYKRSGSGCRRQFGRDSSGQADDGSDCLLGQKSVGFC